MGFCEITFGSITNLIAFRLYLSDGGTEIPYVVTKIQFFPELVACMNEKKGKSTRYGRVKGPSSLTVKLLCPFSEIAVVKKNNEFST